MSALPSRIRAWDLPTRIFHWTLAVLVVFSFASGKTGGQWLDWHMRSGYAILALLAFRLAWGLFGSHTARFASFVRGPAAFAGHARDIAAGRAGGVVGHNPMGGWMVLFMLATLAVQVASGLFADDEIATQGPLAAKVSNAMVSKLTSLHYYNGWVIAGAAALHVCAIAYYWVVLKDNLVGPMWSGWREASPGAAQPPMRASWIAAVFLALSAAAVYWLVVVYPKG